MGESPQDGAAGADPGLKSRRWHFGNVALDERAQTVAVGGVPVELDRKPFEVLLHLLRHAGEVVTKDELLAAVWPGRVLSDSALTSCMARLREALQDDEQSLIKTVHGYGYRLVAEVRVEASQAPSMPRFDFRAGDHPPQRPLWSLVECLGSGGHGEVWLAQHDKTHEHRVFKFALGPEALASIKREITLSRLLQETLGEKARAIVRILDWNLEQAPFFIESEYTSAGSLVKWVGASGGAKALPLATRIDVVIQIAEALALAHSVGVLHKDLKPSNVLVEAAGDGAPHIRLCDFGSGGVLDPDRLDRLGITRLGFTQMASTAGSTSGTPLYLAPEVVAGQPATVQGDLYALGVMLYQLVCGDLNKPLAPGWEHDVADELLCEDVAAAAAGQPQRRLADAATLAQRLRSLEERRRQRAAQRQEKLKAEQAQRTVERLKARRAGLLVALGVLVVGVVTSFSLFLSARRAQQETAQREQELAQVVSFQNSLLKRVKPEVMGSDLMRRLREKVAAAVPAGSAQFDKLMADINATDVAVGQMDESVLKPAVAAVEKDFAATPLIQAALFHALGESYQSLGLIASARAQFERAIALRSAALGPEHEKTLESRVALVTAAANVGTVSDEAEAVLQACHRSLGERHRLTLKLAADVAAQGAYMKGHFAERRKELERILEIQREVLGPEDEDTLTTMSGLAFVVRDKGGRELLEQVAAIQRKRYGAEHQKTLDALFGVAVMLSLSGEFAAARDAMQGILDTSRRVNGTEHPFTLRLRSEIASTYALEGNVDKFQALAPPTLELDRRVLGPDDYSTLDLTARLGESLRQQGKLEEARELQEQALEGRRRALGPEQVMTLWSMDELAHTLAQQKHFDAATKLYTEELEIRQRTQKEFGTVLAPIVGIGDVLTAQGKLQAARGHYEHWLPIISEDAGADDEHTLWVKVRFAEVLKAQNDPKAARPLYESALQGARTKGLLNPDWLSPMNSLFEILKRQGDTEAARKLEAEISAIKSPQAAR